jgi:excisionase family DNA binding protein
VLIDIPTARKHLGGIGESTLRRYIADGKLPVVRWGRRVLIRQSALDRLVKTLERPSKR